MTAKIMASEGNVIGASRMYLQLVSTHSGDGDRGLTLAIDNFGFIDPSLVDKAEYKAAIKNMIKVMPRDKQHAQVIGMLKAKLSDL